MGRYQPPECRGAARRRARSAPARITRAVACAQALPRQEGSRHRRARTEAASASGQHHGALASKPARHHALIPPPWPASASGTPASRFGPLARAGECIESVGEASVSASSRSRAELRALLTRLVASLAAAQGTWRVKRVAIDRRSAISGVWHLSCRTARQPCAERQVPCPTSNQGGRSCTLCWSRLS